MLWELQTIRLLIAVEAASLSVGELDDRSYRSSTTKSLFSQRNGKAPGRSGTKERSIFVYSRTLSVPNTIIVPRPFMVNTDVEGRSTYPDWCK